MIYADWQQAWVRQNIPDEAPQKTAKPRTVHHYTMPHGEKAAEKPVKPKPEPRPVLTDEERHERLNEYRRKWYAEHHKEHEASMKRHRDKMIAEHRCSRCGCALEADYPYKNCERCLKMARKCDRRKWDKMSPERKAAEIDELKDRIAKYKAKHPGYDSQRAKRRRLERIQNHCCGTCGVPLAEDYTMKTCAECRAKANAKWHEYHPPKGLKPGPKPKVVEA